jgi:hypothetical protein
VPEYERPVTLRQMLHHLSGLRDWGVVAFAGGWPRGSRVHTQEHVLDIVGRQKSLNYRPGTEYLYTNTGFNLAAIAAGRAGGAPFPELGKRLIFEPLGMARTQWRDDFTRVVPGRAQAYARRADGYHLDMPFENVYGNGGLLTTVGDLLRWNRNFGDPRVGGEALVRELETPGRLEDGREIRYGLGLALWSSRGVRERAHSGTTAGYRAFLARYPDQKLSLAVLCNAGDAPAARLGRQVAELYLGDAILPLAPAVAWTPDVLRARAGLYRDARSGEPLRIVLEKDALSTSDGEALTPVGPAELRVDDGPARIVFDAAGGFRFEGPEGEFDEYRPVTPATPGPAELSQYAGDYVSDEAEVTYGIAVQDGALVLRTRPGTVRALAPAYEDVFTGPAGVLIFRRDPRGRVEGMSLALGRVRDLRFRRSAGAPPRPPSGTPAAGPRSAPGS